MKRRGLGWGSWPAAGLWLLAGLLLPGASFGQGFMIRPLIMELTARPGERQELEVEVSNTTNNGRFTVDLVSLELGQGGGGGFVPIDPQAPEAATFQGRSCRNWLQVGESSVDLSPMERRKVPLTLVVPRNVRGTYASALAVRRRPSGGTGIQVTVQFLVPVLIQIQGVSALERVQTAGLDLKFIPGAEKRPPTTVASMAVQNSGETMVMVSGRLRLLRPSGEQWRLITDTELNPTRLLPGLTVALPTNLQRSLPSGKYRIQSVMRINGRVRETKAADFDFDGDPDATMVAEDAALKIDPVDLTIKAVPGSHRTALLAVSNPSEAMIYVNAAVATPKSLQGVMLGETRGTDYDCASWLTIEPRAFLLPPGGRRNLKLTMNYPRHEGEQRKPNYYADLRITGAYRDGQSAGHSEAAILLSDSAMPPVELGGIVNMGVTHVEGSQYAVSAKFANGGSTFWTPSATTSLDDRLGFSAASAAMQSEAERVLPLGTPQFSGVLDLSQVDPGAYSLRATMRYNRQDVSQRLPVEITLDGDQRVLRVLTEEELQQGPVGPGEQPPAAGAADGDQPAGAAAEGAAPAGGQPAGPAAGGDG